jgi:hypothetical protein
MKVVRLLALRTGRLYPPGNISGTHFCERLCRPQGRSAAGRIMSIKNRTRVLPVYSAVPRRTARPRVQGSKKVKGKVGRVQDMMAYGGVGVQLQSVLTSAPGGGQLSVSRLGHLVPGKEKWW